MLEGFLLRLAQHPDAEAFALRGGMLVRHWFPEARRPVRDVDLVCSLPFDARGMRERVGVILSDRRIDDGIEYDPERFRFNVLWPESPHPGLRLFAVGRVDGWCQDVTVDFTHRLDVWPRAERTSFVAARGEAKLWTCPPEMLIGRKLQVTVELGRRHWRPKDLYDLWMMLRRRTPSRDVLGEAIERSFVGHLGAERLDDVLGRSSWWAEDRARMRWGHFVRCVRQAPADLEMVVEEVRSHLATHGGSR